MESVVFNNQLLFENSVELHDNYIACFEVHVARVTFSRLTHLSFCMFLQSNDDVASEEAVGVVLEKDDSIRKLSSEILDLERQMKRMKFLQITCRTTWAFWNKNSRSPTKSLQGP
jgi:hypothetical protein